MGAELRGAARNDWTRILLEYGTEIPHYPGVEVIKPARIPPPPLLTGDDPEQWSLQLLRAYNAVVTRRPSVVRLTDLLELPDRRQRLLLQAGEWLEARQTQPVPWCKFALVSWRRYGPAKLRARRPPLQWVYGQARLTQADLWYQWSGATTGGVRLVFSKSHTVLIRRYDRMRLALLAEAKRKDLTSETVKHIVSATLPRGWYRQAVSAAQLEAEIAQAEINAGLRRGADLWG